MTDFIRKPQETPAEKTERQKREKELIDKNPESLSNKERMERGRLMANHEDPTIKLKHQAEVADSAKK